MLENKQHYRVQESLDSIVKATKRHWRILNSIVTYLGQIRFEENFGMRLHFTWANREGIEFLYLVRE